MGELDEIQKIKMEELKKRHLEESEASTTPIEVSDENFEMVVRENPAVVMDMWSVHCPPCIMLAPIIEELASDYAGKVVFGKLSVDENQSVAMKYNVMSIPTLLFFWKGKLVDKTVGVVPKENIEQKLEKIIGEGGK